MYASYQPSNKSKNLLIQMLLLAFVLVLGPKLTFAEDPNKAGSMLLVLEDCDEDNKMSTAPYGDVAFLLNSKCELVRSFHGLSIHSAYFKGPRNISVSENGRFCVVSQTMFDNLTMYETAKHRELWSLSMDINSAVFANDMIYAVNNNNVFAIDNTGIIVKHARIGGLDIAVDTKHDCLWIVGLDVKKCNLDLDLKFKTKLTLEVNKTGAFSVDFDPIGSVWIAERNVDCERGSKNRLVKRSLHGGILKKINLDFSPICLRIDSSDGSIWTTGIIKERDYSAIGDEWPETVEELDKLVKIITRNFTRKYDSKGNLILEIDKGGHSIELDQSDGSAWIGDKTNIWHYSADGRQIGSYTGTPGARKWYAIISDKNQGNKPDIK